MLARALVSHDIVSLGDESPAAALTEESFNAAFVNASDMSLRNMVNDTVPCKIQGLYSLSIFSYKRSNI